MLIDDVIAQAAAIGASDVHLTAGRPPFYRLHGLLYPVDAGEFSGKMFLLDIGEVRTMHPEDTDNMARRLMSRSQYEAFNEAGELDFACAVSAGTRVRVSVFKQGGATAMAIRILSGRVPSLSELGLPDILTCLADRPKGLVLVTGPAGCGKSTTLAAMVDFINREKRVHVLTLEDPVEYLHQHNRSIISQREIGRDTRSFAAGLRAALREDPDVILVGEMRDPETISTAVTAAETGHLVLASLHTCGAAETIDRIIDAFPSLQQHQIRRQLAAAIEGIVSQQLVPRADRPGAAAALEVLLGTPAVRNLIREGKTHQIYSQIQTGAQYGMQTYDMSLRLLYQKNIISREEAVSRATDKDLLNVLEV